MQASKVSASVFSLASFMQAPGHAHVDAARHVLRYILGTLDSGITYHFRSEVLYHPYPHRNLWVGACDNDFRHEGSYAISGVVVLMNGGAVYWRSKAQTTVSNTTTEAEIKAMSLCVEVLKGLVDLWSEMARVYHGIVRVMVDSTGAIS
jgi:hypothetical protein